MAEPGTQEIIVRIGGTQAQGGTNITKYVDFPSIAVEDDVGIKADNLSFTMVILNYEISRPLSHQRIYLERWEWEDIGGTPYLVFQEYEFAGLIERVTQKWVAPPNDFQYDIECTDWTRLLDRRLVTRMYSDVEEFSLYGMSAYRSREAWEKSQTMILAYPLDQPVGYRARDIIQNIIHDFSEGFTFQTEPFLTGTGWSPMMNVVVPFESCDFDHEIPSGAIAKMAEAANCQWYIDFDRVIRYFWIESYDSPLTNNILNIDTDIANFADLEVVDDGSQVKNRVYILDAEVKNTGQFTESFYNAGVPMNRISLTNQIWPVYPGMTQEERGENIEVKVYRRSPRTLLRTMTYILIDEVEGRSIDPAPSIDPDKVVYVNSDQSLIRFPRGYHLGWQGSSGSWDVDQECEVSYYFKEKSPFFNLASIPEITKISNRLNLGWSVLEQDRLAPIGQGIFEYAFSKPDVISDNPWDLSVMADLVLVRQASPLISGQFTSRLKTWKTGQFFRLKSAKWQPEPGQSLDQKVYVTRVTKRILNDQTIESLVSFSSQPFGV